MLQLVLHVQVVSIEALLLQITFVSITQRSMLQTFRTRIYLLNNKKNNYAS